MDNKNIIFFKKMLQKRLEEITLNIDFRNGSLKDLHSTHLKDQSDIVSANLQSQVDSLIIEKHRLELQDITHSLQKIKNGTYGICEMCDSEINIQRLKIKPHAKYCIKCRQLHEKSAVKNSSLKARNEI